ncbi:serine hydrolase domain-containing protein [Kocuria rosea]|uniref:serine hydrolase domain-containing protein n=1 Tax=Kocuria rosea TaxID=1275 RepID=UPI001F0D6738|nr:beta-lactamase family protein [Kocuria rosea]
MDEAGNDTGPGLGRLLAEELARWPVGSAGVAVVDAGAVLASAGDPGPFPWASVTKLLTALTVLHAADEGAVDLDAPAGPPGATVRHLLAHASGLSLEGEKVMSPPGRRRIYSNRGIELAAEHLEHRTGRPFGVELAERVLGPLGLTGTRLQGSPAHGAHGPVRDLGRLGQELLAPRRLPERVLRAATRTSFEGLAGVLPGFGRQDPNDWGLGFEIRGRKTPHWTSPGNAPSTFGHFGQSGSFLWVDPEHSLACAAAGDTAFGPWAAEAWPRLSTGVLETAARLRRRPREAEDAPR